MLIDFPDVPSYTYTTNKNSPPSRGCLFSEQDISLANGRNLQRQKYNTSVIELPYLLLSSFLHAENKWLYEFVYYICYTAAVHARLYILAILAILLFIFLFSPSAHTFH